MTKINNTIKETKAIITNLITKLDIANLGNWTEEKKEINALLTYLQDKTKAKPASLTADIQMDLTEIASLETTLTNLTKENTRLTTENSDLKTKNNEQDGIISNTTIPELIAKLEQYASKVADGELKTSLAHISTKLASLQQNQTEQSKKITSQGNTNYWSMGGAVLGSISVILLGYLTFFKPTKKEKVVEIDF